MDAMRGFFIIAALVLILNLIMGGFAVPTDVYKAEGECNNITVMETCLDTTENGTDCYWCKSAAVPSACYTSKQAQHLPNPVFICTNGSDVLNH